jgi:hypothetical protein
MDKRLLIQGLCLLAVNVLGWVVISYSTGILLGIGLLMVIISFFAFIILILMRQQKKGWLITIKDVSIEKQIKSAKICIIIYWVFILFLVSNFMIEYFVNHSRKSNGIFQILQFLILIIITYRNKKQIEKKINTNNQNGVSYEA